MYAASWRGNCCRIRWWWTWGWGWGGGRFPAPPSDRRFTQMHCRVVWDAGLPTPLCILHGWFIMSSKLYGDELGLVVFLQVSGSDCLPQPLVHPAAELLPPVDCR